jgi:hypothetical protein
LLDSIHKHLKSTCPIRFPERAGGFSQGVVKTVQAADEEKSDKEESDKEGGDEEKSDEEKSDEEEGDAFGRTKNGQPCRTCLTLKKRCHLHPK